MNRRALITSVLLLLASLANASDDVSEGKLSWKELPALPNALGVAGPFVGVQTDAMGEGRDALIVAGGANFPLPVWDNEKQWQDDIFLMVKKDGKYIWMSAGKLPRPLAYGATVSTKDGVVCMGGNDREHTFADVFLLSWEKASGKMRKIPYPPLPQSCAFGQATLVGDVIYLAGGQSDSGLESAMKNFWSLDLSKKDSKDEFVWRELEPWPGSARAFNLTVAQHDGFRDAVYMMSGRSQDGDNVEFLKDVWQYTPATSEWKRRTDIPRCVMAVTAAPRGAESRVRAWRG